MRRTDELVDSIVERAQIPPGKRRRDIRRELRSHIEDFVDAARQAGHQEGDIQKLALAHFGDPGQIANGFAWVYRHERRAVFVFRYSLSTVILASSLFGAMLAMQTSVAWGFGNPVTKVLASRHTVIEGLDIVASVAAYLGLVSLENLFQRRSFPKAAILLMAIVGVVAFVCGASGLHVSFLVFGVVNGVFLRAVQRYVSTEALRAGVVAFCFLLAGFISGLLWSPAWNVYRAATCATWLAMGIGYLMITGVSARVDAALLSGLERMQVEE